MMFVVILFGAAFAVFSYLRPRDALVLLVAMLPIYGVRFSFFGVPSTALEVAIWSVALGWFAHHWKIIGLPRLSLRQAMSEQNPFKPYLWPVLLWLLVATVSAVYSPNAMAALGIWKAYFIEPLMVFVMIVVSFKNREERWWIVVALGVTAVAMAAMAWVQKTTGLFLPEPWVSNRPLRVTSWYSYPNAVGLYLAPIIAMYAVWLCAFKKRSWNFFRKAAAVILGVGAIVFAVSKGAWVGAIAGSFVGALVYFSKQRKVALGIGATIIFAVVAVTPLRERLLDEFLFQSPSGKVRLVVWQETMHMLRDYPIAGAGLAGYQTALIPYHNPWHKEVSPYALEIFLYPHNVFLNFWSELGLAGLVVFVWLEVVFFLEVWKRRDRPLAVIAMAGMVALLVHGLVDVPYFKNDLAVLFWIIMALPLLEPVTSKSFPNGDHPSIL